MRLVTLGRLELEGSAFSEQKPLLLLAYLALGGASVRSEVAERFWGGPDKSPKNLNRSLETALGSLRKVDPELIALPGRGEIGTEVANDVRDLYAALADGDYERIARLYQGPFLRGVERNRRLRLPASGELEEWIINQREDLRSLVQEAMLRQAEGLAHEERFVEAADLAWDAFRLDEAVTYPTTDDYRRLHTLLLAGSRARRAETVREEAGDFADAAELRLCATPQEARARLTSLANLPPPAEIFLGREVEVERVFEKVRTPGVQLVNLVGPPGVGKTELASAVAHRARSHGLYPRGLAFVPFDGVLADAVPATLIEQLAAGLNLVLPGGPAEPEDLANAIGGRDTLLVADNFEHLAHHAGLLADLIARCPALTLLVTSRVVLELGREHLVPVDELEVPPERAADPGSYASVQVFLAAASRRGAEPADGDLPHVARIVRLAGGLPLALHLAAGWSRDLAPADIAARLEASLELFASELIDVPERQRNLLSALGGSWELLSKAEQALFGRLSVFREGFTLEAAEAVAGARVAELRGLGNRSLIRFDAHAKRHRLHPVIRRYGEEKLEAAGDADAVRDRHGRYYLERLMEMVSEVPEVRNPATQRLLPDTANVAAAWHWGVERGWREALWEAGHALEQFFDVTGRAQAGSELLEEAEGMAGSDRALAARWRASRAHLAMRVGDFPKVVHLAQDALAQLNAAKDDLGCWIALTVLGACSGITGDLLDARERFVQALEHVGDRSGYAATTHVNLGIVAGLLDEFEEAENHYKQALSLYRALGRKNGEVQATQLLAELLLDRGKTSEARTLSEAAVTSAEELSNLPRLIHLLAIAARACLDLGEIGRAEEHAAEFHDFIGDLDSSGLKAMALLVEGRLQLAHGDRDAGRRSFEEALEVLGHEQVPIYGFVREMLQAFKTHGDLKTVEKLYEILCLMRDHPNAPKSERSHIEHLLTEQRGAWQPCRQAATLSLQEIHERAIAALS